MTTTAGKKESEPGGPALPGRGPGTKVVNRMLSRNQSRQLTVRVAMRGIMVATLTSVLLGGVVMWLVDPKSFPSVGMGMWFALQTVTTVGYGDVVPHTSLGRLFAVLIMLQGIAFVSIVTATITSSFVVQARKQQDAGDEDTGSKHLEGLQDSINEVIARLERIEAGLKQDD